MFMPRSDELDGAALLPLPSVFPPAPAAGSLLHSKRLPMGTGFGEGQTLNLRLVSSREHRDSAVSLINRRYSWRGYGSQHRLPVGSPSMTFTASLEEAVVGTITLTVDSDRGLAADATFRDELNTYRRVPGAKICELTKFAFDIDAPSRPLLATLFHIVFILGRQRHDCTDLFIEVNPRHRRFYQVMLGFERVGDLKTNESVGAPSQLMRLQVARIQDHIEDCRSATGRSAVRSLYPDFLSEEEAAVVGRVAERQPARPQGSPDRDDAAIWLQRGDWRQADPVDGSWPTGLRRRILSVLKGRTRSEAEPLHSH